MESHSLNPICYSYATKTKNRIASSVPSLYDATAPLLFSCAIFMIYRRTILSHRGSFADDAGYAPTRIHTGCSEENQGFHLFPLAFDTYKNSIRIKKDTCKICRSLFFHFFREFCCNILYFSISNI